MAQAALRTQNAALSEQQCVISSAALYVHICRYCFIHLQAVLQRAAEASTEPLSAAGMRAVAAVAGAWAAQGFPEQELVDACVARSQGMPQDARTSLLQALSAALPAVCRNEMSPALMSHTPYDPCMVPDTMP